MTVIVKRKLKMQNEIMGVSIDEKVLEYIVSIVETTRDSEMLSIPASPRGSRSLFRASKALAAVRGRDFVTPDDVKELVPFVLPHRVALSTQARLENKTTAAVIQDLLDEVPVPINDRAIVGAE